MSRLSRDDVISGLKMISIPEVFADPPVFSIKNFLRSDDDPTDQAEVAVILEKYNGTFKPMRTKTLLTEFLEECELDTERTLCFTTNSQMIYGCYKLLEKHLSWYFSKSLNVNLFHLQMQ